MTIRRRVDETVTQVSRVFTRERSLLGAKLVLLIVFLGLTNSGLWQIGEILPHVASPLLAGLFLIATWMGFALICVTVAWDPVRKVRLAWGGLLVVSALLFMAVRTIVGAPVSFHDAQMYWAMRADTDAALQSFWAAMLPAVAVAGLGLAAFLLPPIVPKRVNVTPNWRLLRWLPVVPAFLYAAGIAWDGGKMTTAFPTQYKLASFLPMVTARKMFDVWPERKAVSIGHQAADRPPHILYIVDESLRGDFLDINQVRGTTPFLLSQGKELANFGYASSAHNCSDQSNAILRWGVTPQTIATARAQPTLWQYAEIAGYATTYIDVQKREGILQNYMRAAEKAEIGTFIAYDELTAEGANLPAFQKDLAAAELITDILKKPAPQLIYFNKEGLHFPFEGKYPPAEALFDNHMDGPLEPIGNNRERLLNSYKNAVHWSADRFLETLLPQIDLEHTLIVYTSDHGQNLLDQGLSTHCRVVAPYFMEGLVPLFVMSKSPTWQPAFQAAAQRNKDRASHFHIFPTLLKVMGFDPDGVQKQYGPSLFDAISGNRKFASGFIFDSEVDWEWTVLPDTLKAKPSEF